MVSAVSKVALSSLVLSQSSFVSALHDSKHASETGVKIRDYHPVIVGNGTSLFHRMAPGSMQALSEAHQRCWVRVGEGEFKTPVKSPAPRFANSKQVEGPGRSVASVSKAINQQYEKNVGTSSTSWLYYAAFNCKEHGDYALKNTVENFLPRIINPDNAARYGYTALAVAAFNGCLQFVEVLLQAGANPLSPIISNTLYPLSEGSRNRGHELVAQLLEEIEKPNQDQSGATPLMKAVFLNDLPKAELLLKFGADPLKESNAVTPLQLAQCEDHKEMVALFDTSLNEPKLGDIQDLSPSITNGDNNERVTLMSILMPLGVLSMVCACALKIKKSESANEIRASYQVLPQDPAVSIELGVFLETTSGHDKRLKLT